MDSFSEGIRSLAYLQSIRDDLFIQLFDEVNHVFFEIDTFFFQQRKSFVE
jgi:hypothetical protein